LKTIHVLKTEKNVNSHFELIPYYKYMKYIEKNRLEKFLNLKGYQLEGAFESTETKQAFAKWVKSTNEKLHVPKKDYFQSSELPQIFNSQELLNEFRKF
jgi:hypothetical protein